MAQANGHDQLPTTPVSPTLGRFATQSAEQWTIRQPPQDRSVSQGSQQQTPPSAGSFKRKAVPQATPILQHPELRLQEAPASPVSISPPKLGIREPEAAAISHAPPEGMYEARRASYNYTPESITQPESVHALPTRSRPSSGQVRLVDEQSQHSRNSSGSNPRIEGFGPELRPPEPEAPQSEGLRYHAFDDLPKKKVQNRQSQMTVHSVGSSSSGGDNRQSRQLQVPGASGGLQRPASTYTLGSELRGRTLSPLSANGSDPGSPLSHGRELSSSRRSPSSRPTSYIDLLNNVPYNQQVAPGPGLNNASLQHAVGNAASLLDTKKTLDMYRANVKKTTDAAVQYEFAVFMVNAAKDSLPGDGLDPDEMINEAKHILARLADRAYPFAQYYLGDGYFSGLFNKDKHDYDKAFPLFVAASKHGHAEAGYRAALCYEFAWGTSKSYPKAIQFYRNAASKNHPGAATRLGLACIRGDMGLAKQTQREGLKWLKRAQESADPQYNSAPYELGLLHLHGFGDDIFKDEAYAAQLLTQSAELGHTLANFLMGRAYENALWSCPRDAALSVHFYNGAATRGHAEAMMALCAWYMVGAEPVLEKDENEAYAWAKQAAETGKSSRLPGP